MICITWRYTSELLKGICQFIWCFPAAKNRFTLFIDERATRKMYLVWMIWLYASNPIMWIFFSFLDHTYSIFTLATPSSSFSLSLSLPHWESYEETAKFHIQRKWASINLIICCFALNSITYAKVCHCMHSRTLSFLFLWSLKKKKMRVQIK